MNTEERDSARYIPTTESDKDKTAASLRLKLRSAHKETAELRDQLKQRDETIKELREALGDVMIIIENSLNYG